MAINKEIYGKGLKFPFKKSFKISDGDDIVKESLYQLIATPKKTRVGRPEVGCNITKRIFDNFEEVVNFGPADIADAIDRFEPRVILLDITTIPNEDQGLIEFYISYQKIKENVVDNLVVIINENGSIKRK